MPVHNVAFLSDVWKSKNMTFTHIYGSYLNYLSLFHVAAVTDDKLIPLLAQCPRIQHVDLSLCEHVTDIGIHALARHCKELLSVRLGGK
jgi:hypothetical protein